MRMFKLGRYAASVLVTAMLTTGAVTLAPSAAHADPQVIRCVRTLPAHTEKVYPDHSVYVQQATLVATKYNVDNVPVDCLYTGEGFLVYPLHTIEFGPYYFYHPHFEYI